PGRAPASAMTYLSRSCAEPAARCARRAACPSFFLLWPRPPPSSTLFPYTTLFRSRRGRLAACRRQRSCRGRPVRSRRCESRSRRSEEHTSELQSRENLVCRLLLEKKKEGAKIPPLFQPASDWRYSGATDVLGRLVE